MWPRASVPTEQHGPFAVIEAFRGAESSFPEPSHNLLPGHQGGGLGRRSHAGAGVLQNLSHPDEGGFGSGAPARGGPGGGGYPGMQ